MATRYTRVLGRIWIILSLPPQVPPSASHQPTAGAAPPTKFAVHFGHAPATDTHTLACRATRRRQVDRGIHVLQEAADNRGRFGRYFNHQNVSSCLGAVRVGWPLSLQVHIWFCPPLLLSRDTALQRDARSLDTRQPMHTRPLRARVPSVPCIVNKGKPGRFTVFVDRIHCT